MHKKRADRMGRVKKGLLVQNTVPDLAPLKNAVRTWEPAIISRKDFQS